HTAVRAEMTGIVAEVEVTQSFENPYERPIEAIYIFPLPDRAAVNDMEIRLEDRVIRGVIKSRSEARALYEAARGAGQTAALLDQQRPNIFTQAVANILPGDEIRVRLRYFEALPYRSGGQEFVFPMVVGPRHTGGAADAEQIAPPFLKPGHRSAHDISIEIRIDAGVAIDDPVSPSHRIAVEREGGQRVSVRLEADDAIPNRDFVLRYSLDGSAPNLIVLPHRTTDEGYFLALLQPQVDPPPAAIAPKEMIFVVDCSGSMSGPPIEKVKGAMRHALQNLDPLDNFQILRFSDDAEAFAPEPAPATPSQIALALDYVENLSGSGGTIMLSGVRAALGYREDPQRLRIVSFMTDGYIGNEEEILSYLRENLGGARLHSFGVGDAVNRYLLDKMAAFGGGSAEYILLEDGSGHPVERFYERIRRPYLTHVSLDWGGLRVSDVHPSIVPDLFLGQPIVLSGRYRGQGSAEVTLRGRLGGRLWEGRFPVRLPERHIEGAAIATLWARERIEALSDRQIGSPGPGMVEEITTTALAHNLVSAYTSFVAVEEYVRNAEGVPVTVAAPVCLPSGVDHDMTVGPAPSTGAVEGIRVLGSTDPITTDSGYSAEFVESLPIIGRNYQDVLVRAPGAVDTDGDGNPNIHGSRDVDVVTLIDAASTTDPHAGQAVEGLALDSIGGVEAESSGASAEFSLSYGGFAGIFPDGKGKPTPGPAAGIRVDCRLESPRREYLAGDPIEVVLTMTNRSKAAIGIPEALSVAGGGARFQILNEERLAVPHPRDALQGGASRSLKPGATATYRFVLNGPESYRLDAPGIWSLVFLGSELGLVDSNRLTIVIRLAGERGPD
ncbi:MAG: VIT and vWA domain-containing protein, partial [Candidatus Polarisedimenticolia bacterium]